MTSRNPARWRAATSVTLVSFSGLIAGFAVTLSAWHFLVGGWSQMLGFLNGDLSDARHAAGEAVPWFEVLLAVLSMPIGALVALIVFVRLGARLGWEALGFERKSDLP